MALTPEQEKNKRDTFDKVTFNAEGSVAAYLKENYELLRTGFTTLAPSAKLTNEDYRRMAKEAIDSREINFPAAAGGVEKISIDKLNAKLMEREETKKFVTERGADHLKKLVPTREQISLIANEAGEVAAENTGSWKGTTFGNAAKGAFKWATGGESNSPAANTVRDGITQRLKGIAQNRDDMKILLSEARIKEIGDRMHDGVMNAGKEEDKSDPLDKVQVKSVDDAIRTNIRNTIYEQVYQSTNKKVSERVDSEVDNIRNGGGIMGFIFKIAEMFGFEKLLASMFGSPIPEKEEIQGLSQRVATTVSEKLTAKDFTHNGKNVSQMNAGELRTAIHSEVKKDLKAHADQMPSFKEAQIEEIASNVSDAIKNNFDAIPKLANPAQQLAAKSGEQPIDGVEHKPGPEENQAPSDVATQAALQNKKRPGPTVRPS